MIGIAESAPTGQLNVDLEQIDTVLNGYGFARPVDVGDFQKGRNFAAELIGPDLATVSVFQEIQEHSGAGMLLYREEGEITGIAGLLMLTNLGRQAILSDTFNGKRPDLQHIAQNGQQVAATYAWLGAATTHASRVAVVTVSAGLRKHVFGNLPSFANAVTPEGAAAVQTYLQMEPLASRPGLFWNPGISAPARTAAPGEKRTKQA